MKELIKEEIEEIRKEYNPENWDNIDTDKLDPVEAYSQGYYRAMVYIQNKLNEDKSLFYKIIDFMSDEGFKHTDQTVDGQDIFEGKKGKIIVEIIKR